MLTEDYYRSKWKRKTEWYTYNKISDYTKDPNALIDHLFK
jgi:hypothetical protein